MVTAPNNRRGRTVAAGVLPAPVTVAVVGHPDHGKSAFIGRFRAEVEGRAEELASVTEWAHAADAFMEEQRDGATLDTTQMHVRGRRRRFGLVDVPGHRELIGAMLTGATQAEHAVLVIAADAGVREQTRRHLALLGMLGLRSVLCAVTRMDLVGYSREAFEDARRGAAELARCIGFSLAGCVPVSALGGDNMVCRSPRTPWYRGPAVFAHLSSLPASPPSVGQGTVFLVQCVTPLVEGEYAIGPVLSGCITPEQRVVVLPEGEATRVTGIRRFPSPSEPGIPAGRSGGLLLDGVSPERGQVLADPDCSAALAVDRALGATVFWFGRTPLASGDPVEIRAFGRSVRGHLSAIRACTDTDTLGAVPHAGGLPPLSLADVRFQLAAPFVSSASTICPALGRFALRRGDGPVCGIGMAAGAAGAGAGAGPQSSRAPCRRRLP